MKLCVKRIYCPGCQRLVRGREETVNGRIRILCARCGGIIWLRDGIGWRYAGKHAIERQFLDRSSGRGKANKKVPTLPLQDNHQGRIPAFPLLMKL